MGTDRAVSSYVEHLPAVLRQGSLVGRLLLAFEAILSGGVGEQNLPVPTADQTPERRNRSVAIVISRQALMSDLDYCRALSVTYRRYRPSGAEAEAARAMSICPTDPASAIPVLEDNITNLGFPLPSRVLGRS